ncbi:probable E3 ubiquitin-protein ligase makorin-1 [Dreissena polymorpha]|uniref:RING-type E3 ubiquitin transferase n=1 Tax=Dreissena polymorpha TaxID=45954 RepID=A0A9D4JPB0_DREPO|nr:probable E3 ubiquitin-protein ligase makorin-1 [Dreissena polymorpha]KAH3819545.1 hypothetical protein DPMN_121284 [Dreissena polymorpha]
MAEASSVDSKNLCRYFLHGVCRRGANCHFSHDRQSPMDNVCKFYLLGCCSYENRCRYDHIRPKETSKPKHIQAPVVSKGHVLKVQMPPPICNSSCENGMVSLKKVSSKDNTTPTTPKPPEEWVKAAEFIPGQRFQCLSVPSSYAHAASNGMADIGSLVINEACSDQLLCPFSSNQDCPYGEDCVYIHGNVCDLCGLAVLMPGDDKQNEQHRTECVRQHERDMEVSFAVARSKDKQCGICMDTVLDKEPSTERRFGILSDCAHCFCLACIRTWRASKQFDSKTIRSCPECRVQSDFVTPSAYWVDTKEEKISLIQGYKEALGKKPCKYFDEGRGDCPFNDRCFYLHMNPDGTKAAPRPYRRRRRRNAEGEEGLEERVTFWDFFNERQERLQGLLAMLEDDIASLLLNLNFFSDSDLSDDDLDDDWLF